ncbi:C-type lectin domain family 1 member A-like isoform X2 [Hyla sarda]|uniref:C-type lectin domain family 1 member A-like isoform X2 n=1 Tax=Hyla sarda TaxID=327740 RepID=UPI0024C40A3D|nr:C-type lectin domain family 1 member A-like isoform X2 [Hyla sarda]
MAVTYADLRFAEIPLREIKVSEDLAETDAEDGDVMYENITGPNQPRVRTAPPAPPTGPDKYLRTGFWALVPLPTLILLLLSLLFLASTIGLTVTYIELSHQFHHLNWSLTQDLQRKEEELSAGKRNLERIWEEKEKMVQEKIHLNASLRECDRRSADLCPDDWILFGRKCLWFTNEKINWWKCDQYCKSEEGNLIVVQKNDLRLQDFLFNKTEDSWVGKEFNRNWYQRWKWPDQYENDWGKCWHIKDRNLKQESCSETKKCVCEKNLVHVSVKKYKSDDSPQLKLWGTSYHCWKND